MSKLLAVITLTVGVASAGVVPIPEGRIIGGDEVPIEEVPHQVSVQYNGGHICGGSIISTNWVLTAAHCLLAPMNHFSIHAGSARSQQPKSVHRITQIYSHPGFENDATAFNDIAVIQVEEPFVYDETRQPIALYAQDEQIADGSIATISGWGQLADDSFPETLRLVRVPMISKVRCAAMYSQLGTFLEGQICALDSEGRKGSCHCDSGGPITIDGRQAGLVSWSLSCAGPEHPDVYTEVAYFRDWIKTHSGV